MTVNFRFSSARVVLLLIVVLGIALRLYGINFGLPALYHADEPIVVNHALGYGTGDLNPHFFKIPPFLSYMLFVLYGIFFFFGKAAGLFLNAQSFALAFLQDPTAVYCFGRIFSGVFFGGLTIIAVYALARRLFSVRAGAMAAFFISVAFIHVQNSHYIYVDVPMVFFIVLTCIAGLGILERNSPKDYFLAGLYAGFAAATKYNAALVGIVILTAAFFRRRDPITRKGLAVSFFTAVAICILTNPFCILDMRFFLQNIFSQAQVEYPAGWLYHITYSLKEGIGILLVAAGFAGICMSLFNKRKEDLVVLSFPIVFYLVLVLFSQAHERYILPVTVFFLVYAAGFIDRVARKNMAAIVLACVLAAPTLHKSIYSGYLFSRQDTRSLAKAWIQENIPAGSSLAVEHSFFCPKLRQTAEQLKEKYAYIKESETNKKRRLDLEAKAIEPSEASYNVYYLKDASVVGSGFLFEQPQLPFAIEALKSKGIRYVVMHIDSKENIPHDFYLDLQKRALLIREFSPYKDKKKLFAQEPVVETGGPFASQELFSRVRNGYRIQIFQLR